MVSLVGPVSVGVAPASALWFEPATAFLILIGSLVVSAMAILCAGHFAGRSRRAQEVPPPTRTPRELPQLRPAGIVSARPAGLPG